MMTTFQCRGCGRGWSEGPTLVHDDNQLCRRCVAEVLQRGMVVQAEASEAGTDRERADYYKNLCNLQREVIDSYHRYIHAGSGQPRLNDASPREWDLGTRCYYFEKDNDALRELCEEYRKALEEAASKIN